MAETGELSYYFSAPAYDKEKLFWKDERDAAKLTERLTQIETLLSVINENDFTRETIKGAIWDYAEKEGRGQVLWPFRVALSGKDKSPDPLQLSEIFGKTETITRLQHAISLCHE